MADSDKMPPAGDVEYPEKPGEDASQLEMMQWMELVDAYWMKRGRQRLESNDEETDGE